MAAQKKGSVMGGMLLIAGSCIGAGMLGLPISTGIPGFFPSLLMFFIAWAFMLSSSLLLVEVMGWFNRPVNFISMVGMTLGRVGRAFCWILYLFLFYTLLIAYMALSSNHISLIAEQAVGLTLPHWSSSLFFVLLFGWLIYLGTRQVDYVNRYLMVGKLLCFALIVVVGIHYITPRFLMNVQMRYALFTLPILIISFGFQNMVPVLMKYMGGDRKRVRQAIYAGSLLTLALYLIWEVIAIGILPLKPILNSYRSGTDAAEAIRLFLGSHLLGVSVQGLALFSILTSFLAQGLSLTHFLSDGFTISHKRRENGWICFLTLFPPLLFSIVKPDIFFKAINFAGGICAVTLFGVLPALMVWIGRYRQQRIIPDRVPGGRPFLVVMLLIATFIFLDELTNLMGLPLFPKP